MLYDFEGCAVFVQCCCLNGLNEKVVRKQENRVISDENGKGRGRKNGEDDIFLRNGRVL